jgi:hypothetical protein
MGNLMNKYITLIIAILIGCSQIPDYKSFPKIDAHVHLETADESFIEVARLNNFRLISLVTNYHSTIEKQFAYTTNLHKKYPETVDFLTTFDMKDFDKSDWQDNVIKWLEKCFNEGAAGVKNTEDWTFRKRS